MYYITLNIIVKLIIELFIELFIELTFDFIKLAVSLISAPYCSQNRIVVESRKLISKVKSPF